MWCRLTRLCRTTFLFGVTLFAKLSCLFYLTEYWILSSLDQRMSCRPMLPEFYKEASPSWLLPLVWSNRMVVPFSLPSSILSKYHLVTLPAAYSCSGTGFLYSCYQEIQIQQLGQNMTVVHDSSYWFEWFSFDLLHRLALSFPPKVVAAFGIGQYIRRKESDNWIL